MPLERYTEVDAHRKPLLGPDEEISFTSDATDLFIRADRSEGTGTLFVTTKSDTTITTKIHTHSARRALQYGAAVSLHCAMCA